MYFPKFQTPKILTAYYCIEFTPEIKRKILYNNRKKNKSFVLYKTFVWGHKSLRFGIRGLNEGETLQDFKNRLKDLVYSCLSLKMKDSEIKMELI